MTEHKPRRREGPPENIRVNAALSPVGKPMTIDDLPPADTQRWVIRRKAEVVAGVHGGLITMGEACRRYRLSVDEFRSWERLLRAHGLAGLSATRAKKYRGSGPDSGAKSGAGE